MVKLLAKFSFQFDKLEIYVIKKSLREKKLSEKKKFFVAGLIMFSTSNRKDGLPLCGN